jgi:hypothetical protein
MLAVEAEEWSLAGAFLLGAIFATIATLRVLRAVTDFLTGLERRRRLERRQDEEP